MVRGLKAEKFAVVRGKAGVVCATVATSSQSAASFSSSIQKGGAMVMCAGDFSPTLQPYFSFIHCLQASTFSSRWPGSTTAMKYMLLFFSFMIIKTSLPLRCLWAQELYGHR